MLLYILYIVYFNADSVYICIHFMPVFSSLYTVHIYVAFTIFYWHYSHHTIIQYSLVSPFPLHSHPTLPHPTLLVKLHLKQLLFLKKQTIYLFILEKFMTSGKSWEEEVCREGWVDKHAKMINDNDGNNNEKCL